MCIRDRPKAAVQAAVLYNKALCEVQVQHSTQALQDASEALLHANSAANTQHSSSAEQLATACEHVLEVAAAHAATNATAAVESAERCLVGGAALQQQLSSARLAVQRKESVCVLPLWWLLCSE
eukprot:TRINITY_DN34223_c0_g1_i1.p1 TRINITY_DN34223_c0_g1~~TRINITY_DN34223_c0_g1_i1.p1  ORF type:complete len:124 (-),score=66.97 TRINITY_DN34223_c0_g1_i1:82-453(-)